MVLNHANCDDTIMISPKARDPFEIPEVSLADYLFRHLNANLPRLRGKPWLVNVDTGVEIKFDEVEEMSRRVASALTRLGFTRGDAFYFVTFESVQLYVILLAVWRLGGSIQGWYQRDKAETYAKQMHQSKTKFVLMDEETSLLVNEAIEILQRDVTKISFGNIEGAMAVDEMFKDDGSAFPEKVEINPREDVAFICYTSGSTGDPKGAMHSNHAAIAVIHAGIEDFGCENSMMVFISNFSMMVSVAPCMLISGCTLYCFSQLGGDKYFDSILKYKPDTLMLYPFVAASIVRSPQMKTSNMDFLKRFISNSAALDFGTVRLLQQLQPHIIVQQLYGMTECMLIASSKIKENPNDPMVYGNKDHTLMSVGKLLPYVKAKVVDVKTGRSLRIGERGNICVKSPTVMKGYNMPGQKSNIDKDGWLLTEDLGFLDYEGNLFLLERLSFTFYHRMDLVFPSEIEQTLQDHPAVLHAGVVGIPDPETNAKARAYVMLRPDHHATADELTRFVAARLPYFKQLHGGLRFLDALPLNRNGKLDRIKLREMSKAELSET